MTTTRILIFAKAPQPGLAKTRLIPVLGANGAAELARTMLENTLREALAAEVGPVELCVTPNCDEPAWREFAIPAGVDVSNQGDGDLGVRMARAAECALAKSERVLLIGTDCVEMQAKLLREAALILHEAGTLLYCTVDGGYAVLGLSQFSPALFSDIRWSTPTVASETISRIGRLGWLLHLGCTLHDVDEPDDLKLLPDAWVPYARA